MALGYLDRDEAIEVARFIARSITKNYQDAVAKPSHL
jgi:hypothetical protein